jgi:O-antigen/teichoic acid export membrane protein
MVDGAEIQSKLFKGAGLIAFGIGFDLLFSFFAKVGIARYLGTADFGLFSIGFALVSVTTVISLVGLPDGIARMIPRVDSRRKEAEFIVTGLFTSLGTAIVIAVGIILLAEKAISLTSYDTELVRVLRIASLGIPLLVVARLAVGVGRGYENARMKVLIENFLRPGTFFAAIAAVIVLGIENVTATYIIPVSYLPGAIVGVYYLSTLLNDSISVRSLAPEYRLITFSAPLMISGFMRQIMNHLDTFILAAFRPAANVGIYNAIYPVSRLSNVFLAAFGFIAMPIFSSIDSESESIESVYQFTTKWIVFGALPILLCFILLSKEVTTVVFGPQYVSGNISLVILTLGFSLNTILGPNANALIALGENRAILRYTIFSALLNTVLNLLLIPTIGIEGAAVATGVSYVVLTLLYSMKLYSDKNITPITQEIIGLIATSGGVGVLLSTLLTWVSGSPIWTLVLFLFSFIPVYIVLASFIGVINRNDLRKLISLVSTQP